MKTFLSSAFLVASLFLSVSAFAIPETGYEARYRSEVLPFLRSGERFDVPTEDGLKLSGVRFLHPSARGIVFVSPGRSEAWLKYGEVFFDLYEKGFSVYSYDHRGQGLSPHFVKKNRQIGHIHRFSDYVRDMNRFVETVLKPQANGSPLYLLAHSMGGAISLAYLETYGVPFQAIALSGPMLQIDTSPFPEGVAKAITGAATSFGLGQSYALGQRDDDPNATLDQSRLTTSPARFWMAKEVNALYPESVIGGASNEWVYRSIIASEKIWKALDTLWARILVFQAGQDRVVRLPRMTSGCNVIKGCHLVKYPDAKHEVLMERDAIRSDILMRLDEFFR